MSKPPGSGKRGRAAARAEFLASRSGSYDPNALADAMAERMAAELAAAPIAALAVGASDKRRWVPIGPSVIRSISTREFRRATGRVRDIQVSDDGKRAYAASAKGGLWYSDDAGQFWSPVGGWAVRAAVRGGVNSAQACGCLTVWFGPTAADDFVMVGTGELQGFSRAPIRPALAGLGVLSAKGPVAFAGGADPWEPEAGIAVFEGLGIFKLTRDPDSTPGKNTAPKLDRVLAATSSGLFLGVRGPGGPLPHTGKFSWTALPAIRTFMGLPAGRQPFVTDVLWLANGAPDGRIVVAVALGLETADGPAPTGSGVAYSDDLGATYKWVTNLNPKAVGAHKAIGRMSLAKAAADRVYVLGERHQPAPPDNIQSLWQVPAMNAATPTATIVGGMKDIWTRASTGKNQRDYDQAIAVEVVGVVDRVYLGGNYHPVTSAASVWCFDVQAGPTLAAAPGISRAGAPLPTPPPPPPPLPGDGAVEDGMVGDDIHPDVHNIRLPGPSGVNRPVWVATDGGIYVSNRAGRVNTFESRASGLAAAEVQFHAPHPTSTHFGAIGVQDNGRQVRVGDVVWEDVVGGDGGGVVFHPERSEILVGQFTYSDWTAPDSLGFQDPLSQGVALAPEKREHDESSFYSGASMVKLAPARLAVGTNRVWLSDDVGPVGPNTWNVLPFLAVAALATNPRTGGTDAPADRGIGVPGGPPFAAVVGGKGPFGPVLTVKWANARTLLALFAKGLVTWKQDAVSLKWTHQVLVAPVSLPGVTGSPSPSKTLLSDLAPIPGTDNFYLVTTGDPSDAKFETCLYFDNASTTFRKTGLRAELGPLNPGYAVVVDPGPGAGTDVYVGTAAGVWRGERFVGPPPPGDAWPHTWTPEVNGTPQNVVQDLSIWHNPAVVGGPRLLRAAMQSRGVWEMDLNLAKADRPEPRRTYVRVHAADDRRIVPTPLINPRRAPVAPAVALASPDIMVRPQPSPDPAPAWRLPVAAVISGISPDEISGFNVAYEIWTFQTAFRWIYPSVQADGRWGDALERLIELHRTTHATLAGPANINKKLWDAVVRGTTVDALGAATTSIVPVSGPNHAVYRPAWQNPANMSAVATEIDLIDHVRPSRTLLGVDYVYTERCTVDVLIHHRDTRTLAKNDAFAILLWRSAATQAALEAFDVGPTRTYATAVAGGAAPGSPGPGWNEVLVAGSPLHPLPVELDARMPRAVSIDVDFSGVTPTDHVLIMAFVGSSVDRLTEPPVGLPASPRLSHLTTGWPYAAARIVRVVAR